MQIACANWAACIQAGAPGVCAAAAVPRPDEKPEAGVKSKVLTPTSSISPGAGLADRPGVNIAGVLKRFVTAFARANAHDILHGNNEDYAIA